MFDKYPDVLNIADLQTALSIGRSMAYRLINEGHIKHLRIGKSIKIPKTFLIDYVAKSSEMCYNEMVVSSAVTQEGGKIS